MKYAHWFIPARGMLWKRLPVEYVRNYHDDGPDFPWRPPMHWDCLRHWFEPESRASFNPNATVHTSALHVVTFRAELWMRPKPDLPYRKKRCRYCKVEIKGEGLLRSCWRCGSPGDWRDAFTEITVYREELRA